MKLGDLLRDVDVKSVSGARDVEISSLAYHSVSARRGGLFCAWKGLKSDGHDYVAQAVARGAVAVVVEREMEVGNCVRVVVPLGRAAFSVIAANFFGRPAEKLCMVGVTGTNGKTSVTTLVRRLLEKSGCKTGLVGTIGYDLGGGSLPAERTTPEGLELQEYFSEMVKNGCKAAAMEVSSHALEQGRVEGISYRVAVFTNLTQDHLDYHGTMENYFLAKQRLFERLREGAVAVLNADDEYSKRIEGILAGGVRVIRFGILSTQADFAAENIRCSARKTQFILKSPEGKFEVESDWLGGFSVSNILAGIAAGFALGLSVKEMVGWVKEQPCVPGRMEVVPHEKPFSVVVDYAHTDDAVRKVLEALRSLKTRRLKVLIGCGGNRDKSKRPLMARAACELADDVFFTSDNPRDEDPMQILYDMLAGVRGKRNFHVYPDRKEAIREILRGAENGDVVLLAGKGHEKTQEIQGNKYPFSDREVAWKILQGGAS